MEKLDGLDLLLSDIGTNRWTITFFITCSLVTGIIPPNLIGSEFLNPVPNDFTCKHGNESQCSYIDNNNVTTPCTEWIYDTTMFHSTIAMEWNLVCDAAYIQPLFQISYTIGCLFGCVFGGLIGNRYGRRKALRIGLLFSILGAVSLPICPHYYMVLIIRLALGIANTMMIYPGFILCMEICTNELRPIAGVLLAFPYALMMIIFSVMAYFIRDWKWLHIASSGFLFPLFVGTCIINESPRWLLVNGHVEETIKVLKKASSYSKRMNSEYLEERIKKIHEELSSKNVEKDDPWWSLVLSLFTHKDMRKITFIVTIIWFLQGIVYLGIPLNADAFSSPFLYMGLMGIMELPAYSLSAPVTKVLGRKPVIGIGFILSGVSVASVVVLNYLKIKIDHLDLMLTLIGFWLACMSFQVNFIYASELFPTTVRPYGTGFVLLICHVGYNVPPFITDYMGDTMPLLPTIIYSCCGLVSGVLVFFLPETNKKPLMETLADLARFTCKDKL